MQKVQAHDDESGSGSAVSDLGNLENDTDTLGRAILRHERDARRLQSVLDGARQHLGHNTSRPYTSRRLQQMEARERGSVEIASRRIRDSEPDLNVPRAWSRRYKAEQGWTRHSQAPASNETHTHTNAIDIADKDMIVPHKTVYTGDEYWDENDDINVEDTPPSMRRRRPIAQQTSLRHMNQRMKEIIEVVDTRSEKPIRPVHSTSRSGVPQSQRSLDVKARLEEFRQRRYPRTSGAAMPRPVSPAAMSDKENMPEQDQRNDAMLPTSSASRQQIKVDPSQSDTNYNRSGSIQMLERLAKATQSPPRSSLQTHDGPGVEAATPLITGGWIDTPKPGRSSVHDASLAPPQSRTNVSKQGYVPDQQGLQDPAKDVLGTIKRVALAEIRPLTDSEVKGSQPDQEIVSLPHEVENAPSLHASPRPKNRTSTGAASPSRSKHVGSTSAPIHASSELSRIAALNKHITQVLTTHRTSTRGSKDAALATNATTEKVKPSANNGHASTFCEHCDSAHRSVWSALWIEFRSNFYVKDKTAPLGIKFTVLGTAVLFYICWYLMEAMLCHSYCQPRYATWMAGTGVDPKAPVFPFVLPTLLLRPFEPAWRPLKQHIDWLMGLALNLLIGEDLLGGPHTPIVTFRRSNVGAGHAYQTGKTPVQWATAASTVALTSSRRAVASVVDAIDDLGRMWD